MDAIYEFHVNIPVVSETIENAKVQVRQHPIFQKKKMHIDGVQEIKSVSGYKITPIVDASFFSQTEIRNDQERGQ